MKEGRFDDDHGTEATARGQHNMDFDQSEELGGALRDRDEAPTINEALRDRCRE
jgi:hypothetical protein